MLKIKHIRLREKYGEGEATHEAKTGADQSFLHVPFLIGGYNQPEEIDIYKYSDALATVKKIHLEFWARAISRVFTSFELMISHAFLLLSKSFFIKSSGKLS